MGSKPELCDFCKHALPTHHRQCYVGNLPSAREISASDDRRKQKDSSLQQFINKTKKKP